MAKDFVVLTDNTCDLDEGIRKEYGIEYSTSVWDVTSAKEICTLKPKLIKVPSACNLNKPMLQYLCDYFEGEIHLSFGMTTKEEDFIEKVMSVHSHSTVLLFTNTGREGRCSLQLYFWLSCSI